MSVLRGVWAPVAATGLGIARFGGGVLVAVVLAAVLVGLLLTGRTVALRQRAPHGRHRVPS